MIINKTKRNAFLVLLFVSFAIAGYFNVSRIWNHDIPFYNSASVRSIQIDSISMLESEPEHGVYAIIGYGYLDAANNYCQVDMTEGVDINSFSIGEAYALIGQTFEVYVNSDFNLARLKRRELSAINAQNKKYLLLYSLCFLPLILLICFWIFRRRYKKPKELESINGLNE